MRLESVGSAQMEDIDEAVVHVSMDGVRPREGATFVNWRLRRRRKVSARAGRLRDGLALAYVPQSLDVDTLGFTIPFS